MSKVETMRHVTATLPSVYRLRKCTASCVLTDLLNGGLGWEAMPFKQTHKHARTHKQTHTQTHSAHALPKAVVLALQVVVGTVHQVAEETSVNRLGQLVPVLLWHLHRVAPSDRVTWRGKEGRLSLASGIIDHRQASTQTVVHEGHSDISMCMKYTWVLLREIKARVVSSRKRVAVEIVSSCSQLRYRLWLKI